MAPEQSIRVLIAKPGLDGHDRGAKVIARALEESGMQVAYTGIRQTPAMIVDAAIEQNADVVGLSILSGAHMELMPLILEGVHERGLENIVVLVGGIIPEDDVQGLVDMGVHSVFGPGTSTRDIIEFINGAVDN